MDQGGGHPTYRDITTPSKVVAYLGNEEDNGAVVIVYGYDSAGNVLKRQENSKWLHGYRVPTIYGLAVPDESAPVIGRITGVYKDKTVAEIRLSTIDDSGPTGTTLGIYEPDEEIPQYRRIKINRSSNWVRVSYLKTSPTFSSQSDHVPLRSRLALLMALQARKCYSEVTRLGEAQAYESHAMRLELESQVKSEAPLYFPLQVVNLNSIKDQNDWDIR